MRTVTAVGHRGDPYRFRENTLASLLSAFASGADAVELDVRLTRDGVPLLLHDATLARLWEIDARLGDVTAEDVARRTGGGVPSLADALGATSGRRVMIDLPSATARTVRAVLGVVRDSGATSRVYYCAGADAMLAVRAQDPDAEIALTWTTLAPPRPALLDVVRPRWLNYRFGLLDAGLVASLHRAGYLVSAWTPDTRRSLRRLLAAGVDSVTSNRVGVACEERTRAGLVPPSLRPGDAASGDVAAS
ncbi:glycerophosphodiester phosphodiesterase [Streptomyces sp. SPB074]|uniref:glycerophosphodiester phosphodiesterase n=1 Tax=Streptomyces sp. (strain SPB074) TaxID=465543 RepID=UPI00017F0E8D|nr:glycerophosphodiester phosphodiesterase [Streptomyces sp. SPB074]EDY44311.1 glycerophosphoryl diester phosphodiesterase [Streptomyces sp. SPB074]